MELDIESRIFKETTQDFFLKISFPKCVLFPFFSLSLAILLNVLSSCVWKKRGRSSDVESVRLGINRTGKCVFPWKQPVTFPRSNRNAVVCVRHIFRVQMCAIFTFSHGPRVRNYLPLPGSLFKQMRKRRRTAGLVSSGQQEKPTSVLFTHSLNDYSDALF